MSSLDLALPVSRGSYVLALEAMTPASVRVGALGRRMLEAGVYLYVGSAFGSGGIRARLSRHLLGAQTLHWHVDYLRTHMSPVAAWYQAQNVPMEHRWAQILGAGRGITVAWPGFGVSDCHCRTHLFYAPEVPSLALFKARLGRAGCDSGGLSEVVTAK